MPLYLEFLDCGASHVPQRAMAEEELSDEQLHQLLKDAEQRLKSAKQNALSLPSSHKSIPKVSSATSITPYINSTSQGAQVDRRRLVNDKQRALASRIRVVEDPVAIKTKAAQAKKATAGSNWYNLPKTVVTPELKRDLQLLKMRDVLDPKRFYKKDNSASKIPEFSQVGTVIEGPTEYFSGRLSNKERKQTFAEEILTREKSEGRFKAKYNAIQEAKTSGKKAHFKKLKQLRRGGASKNR